VGYLLQARPIRVLEALRGLVAFFEAGLDLLVISSTVSCKLARSNSRAIVIYSNRLLQLLY
jgi:hypothetical protein